jgi:protein disulfide-isomerase A6
MKSLLAILLSLLVLSAVAEVRELDPNNFDSVVDGSKAVFVEFFAPWCGHCKNLAPEYEIVGQAFERFSEHVIIAKVDADQHKDLGGRFNVHGFPTLKFFPKGSTTPEDYQGGRTADDIINFINDKTGTKARVKKEVSAVVDLNDKNFDDIVKNPTKDVLVEFFAPWCGHCKHLAPDYEKVGIAYRNEPNVVIAKLDADQYKDIAGRYGVSGFPTLKWFGKNNKEDPLPYDSSRDPQSFLDFINGKAGTHRTLNGMLDSKAGRIESLDHLASKFMAENAEKASILKEAEQTIQGLQGEQQKNGKYYVKVMQTIQSKGKEFVSNEQDRLDRMLAGSIAPAKSDEFVIRKNILSAFSS